MPTAWISRVAAGAVLSAALTAGLAGAGRHGGQRLRRLSGLRRRAAPGCGGRPRVHLP
jgi:hypothetical protein